MVDAIPDFTNPESVKFWLYDLQNVDYWQAGETWEQMEDNEGHDGFGLTEEKIKELKAEWPEGFYLQAWKKDNEGSEPDLYFEPGEI